jgi:DNA-binding GntR family transcriptional regulator
MSKIVCAVFISDQEVLLVRRAARRKWSPDGGNRVRRLAFPAPNHLDIVLAEHMAIVDGLKSRDPDSAAAGMKIHLDRVFLTIRRLIVEKRDYFAADAGDFLDEYTRSSHR